MKTTTMLALRNFVTGIVVFIRPEDRKKFEMTFPHFTQDLGEHVIPGSLLGVLVKSVSATDVTYYR